MDKSTQVGKDLLSLVVKANMAHDLDEGQHLSDYELVCQVSTFILAGTDTTSKGLTWLLWRLAQDQKLQQRLRDVVSAVDIAEPTLERLDNIPLLENVIREAMRLDSPIAETTRQTSADTVLPLSAPILTKRGIITALPLPKGTMIVQSRGVVHLSKEIWGDDADKFNPDRYDRPNCPSAKVPGSYGNLLVFGGGARNCM